MTSLPTWPSNRTLRCHSSISSLDESLASPSPRAALQPASILKFDTSLYSDLQVGIACEMSKGRKFRTRGCSSLRLRFDHPSYAPQRGWPPASLKTTHGP